MPYHTRESLQAAINAQVTAMNEPKIEEATPMNEITLKFEHHKPDHAEECGYLPDGESTACMTLHVHLNGESLEGGDLYRDQQGLWQGVHDGETTENCSTINTVIRDTVALIFADWVHFEVLDATYDLVKATNEEHTTDISYHIGRSNGDSEFRVAVNRNYTLWGEEHTETVALFSTINAAVIYINALNARNNK